MGSLPVSRRTVLGMAALVPATAAIGAAARPGGARPLQLRPPKLDNPGRIVLSDEMLRSQPSIDLRGPGRDWIIVFPKDRYLTEPVRIHGHDEARHIVMIGGGIRPTSRYDPATMKLNDGSDWAVYALRGFTGATGGTFRLRIQEKSYIKDSPPPYTRDLPWDATPRQIFAALEETAGKGAVFAVDGPATPGGPWKIVPSNGPLLGRVVLDISGLQGATPVKLQNVFLAAAGCGLLLKQWRGVVHCEGLHVGGEYCSDGIDIQNPWGNAVAQLANIHSAPHFHPFHDDWVHPDGAQFYLGPSVSRMENVDLVSLGGNAFISQPRKAPRPRQLENLYDWWFRNCHFHSIKDDRANRAADSSDACYREDDYPGPGLNRSGQLWDMENVYCSRRRASDGKIIENDLPMKYYNYMGGSDRPAGLHLGPMPPDEFFANPVKGQCGPGYETPGYAGPEPQLSPVRLGSANPTSG